MSLHGEITIRDAAGKILCVLSVAEAIAARDREDQKRRHERPTRDAITAAVGKAKAAQRASEASKKRKAPSA